MTVLTTTLSDTRDVLTFGTLAAVGACVGSFVNVVAYRLPRACMSVVKPRSRCPKCTHAIAWYDNLPIISWMLLRARCRGCRAPISARYPAIEAGVAALFILLAWMVVPHAARVAPYEHGGTWALFVVEAIIVTALVALTLIDIDWRILPDQITIGGMVLGPVLACIAPRVQPSLGWFGESTAFGRALIDAVGVRGAALTHGVVGLVVSGGLLWGIGALGTRIFKKEAMGFGDVKMFAAMGGVLGLWSLLAFVVAAISGAVIGVVVRAMGGGRYVPFGPFLALGMLVVMLRGDVMLDAWLGMARR